MCNHHQLGHLVLHQFGHSVDTCLQGRQSFGGDVLLSSGFLFSLGQQLLPSLRPVIVGQLKQLRGYLLIQGLDELVNGWGHVELLAQDGLLPLDIVCPFDEAGETPPGLHVLADAKVFRPLLE